MIPLPALCRPQYWDDHHDPPSQTRIGNYVVIRELGRGGMGVVYEAMNESLRRRAAIKVLNPVLSQNADMVTRFFNEARAANIIEHPGIVEIYEYGHLPDGAAYFVMEFLKGESLGARLRRVGQPLGAAALHLGHQIASVLAAAHDKHIVHRDLKPDNVMLVPDAASLGGERIKVLDFGIAKLAAEHEGPALHTASGVLMGTPTYMSPEQCRGAGKVDERADVYSLGVMLYLMVCGRLPFIAEGSGVQIAMHLFNAPRPIRDVNPAIPAELAELVHAMLAKEPAERPSMAGVAERLSAMMRASLDWKAAQPGAGAVSPIAGAALGNAGVDAPSTLRQATGQGERVSFRRRQMIALGAASSLLLLLVGVTIYEVSRSTPDGARSGAAMSGAAPAPPAPTEAAKPQQRTAPISPVPTDSSSLSAASSPAAPVAPSPKDQKADRRVFRPKPTLKPPRRLPASIASRPTTPPAIAPAPQQVPPAKPKPSFDPDIIKSFKE